MKVVVRTHGGLGNQLFQLLYARLYAAQRGASLFEVHDLRYPHAFKRSGELALAPRPPALMGAVSALRLPKIIMRLKPPCEALNLFGTTYLDGYFQNLEDYERFDEASVRRELQRLRAALQVQPAPAEGQGVHIRLGDFFKSEAEVLVHLNERLDRIGPGAGVVTNEEHRLSSPAILARLAAVEARIVPTSDMSPEQVLRTLAGFATVDGNDSTLLFWASVLSGMACRFRDARLEALRAWFQQQIGHGADAEAANVIGGRL